MFTHKHFQHVEFWRFLNVRSIIWLLEQSKDNLPYYIQYKTPLYFKSRLRYKLGMNPGTIPIPKSRDSEKFSNPEIPGLKCRDPGTMKLYENLDILKFFMIFCQFEKISWFLLINCIWLFVIFESFEYLWIK